MSIIRIQDQAEWTVIVAKGSYMHLLCQWIKRNLSLLFDHPLILCSRSYYSIKFHSDDRVGLLMHWKERTQIDVIQYCIFDTLLVYNTINKWFNNLSWLSSHITTIDVFFYFCWCSNFFNHKNQHQKDKSTDRA